MPLHCLDVIRGTHLGQRSWYRTDTGRTHDRFRTAIKSCKFPLEPNGPSRHVAFATKPALASMMIGRAIDAGVPFAWVAADSVYGVGEVEKTLRRAGRGYVLGVRIPMKPAMHSNPKPATASDTKPASVPI